ncbi:MAG: ATP-dependent DNA helicase RecG [Caulobacteraceae bacterium]|nr:ATP-dependent DNA helicase RecG [Caulobacteraceae bacterium]
MRPEILFPLFAPVSTLKGTGPKTAPLIARVAGPLVRDLVFTAPHSVIFRSPATAATAVEGEVQTFEVAIVQHLRPGKVGAPYKVRVSDPTGFMHLIYFKVFGDHLEKKLRVGSRWRVSGRVERFGAEVQIAHPDYLIPADSAEFPPSAEPVYPATAGLTSRQLQTVIHRALEKTPELPEWQDSAWLIQERLPSWREAVALLHAPETVEDVSPICAARRRLAYDELLAHQLALGRRKKARQAAPAPRLSPGPASSAMEAALPFRLTGAQQRALTDIRRDIAAGARMSRLLHGDVGSGKTVVAALAMADAASNGLQAALMAPTEILARQHFERLKPLWGAAGLDGVLLTGRDKGRARQQKLAWIADGSIAFIIGTHALFQESVEFRDLGLVVLDEQHRFGVAQRQQLQDKGRSVHVLALSATPIPRTLELTQFGDLEVSRLDEKPPGRKPVATRAIPGARIGEVVARLRTALESGAQAYWICPLVSESEASDLAAAEARWGNLTRALGDGVGLVHGRMSGPDKDAVMTDFAEGRIRLLVATTVVEVGVDVPNATIMVIEHAERFGLAQLHQLRGRVGRGAAESACILLYEGKLSEAASTRLDVLRRTEDGFEIAETDWALRGGGDLLGLKQSGFPDYRIADPVAHRDLLFAAAADARMILQKDPGFVTERGKALRVLTELYDWRPDRTDAPA